MKGKKTALAVLVPLLLAMILFPMACVSVPGRDKVAVIPLSGTITAGSSFFSPTITPQAVKEQLDRAERDKVVKAVVLRVESPGGVVAPCQEILEEIERVKQSKPVVVSMGEQATSGGYYISCKADKIVALPGTLTGSIGVIAEIPNVQGLYEKLGIQMQIFKGGKYKDMYAGLRELTPEEREIMQEMVDVYYEQFVAVVAEGRGLSTEQVKNLATGQIYTGVEAKELGLVDELGGVDTAINLATQLAGVVSPEVEYYQQARPSLRSLLGLADIARLRLLGLSGQDIILLQILSNAYPQPQYLYQS
ncbi:MAG: signal peptide peptidase SppA [Chloroflexota bacterium]|nr:signal peptide peptidase SppA [Chloroflexota bacterium]